MDSTSSLSGSHLRTYRTIFQHPISHNLEWRNVASLLGRLCEVAEESNGNLRATRNGHVLVLHPPRTKDITELHELMNVRHFLEQSETPAPAIAGQEEHWLLLIDHRGARIYRSELRDAVPVQILPYEPDEYFRHAHHSKDFSRGEEKPDPNSFFEPVAAALRLPGPILIFGTGTGTSSEMDQFVKWLGIHHPEQAGRIVGAVVVDGHHSTEDQLLAKSREFYAARQASLQVS
jgi:hypothetical protein